MVQHLKTVMGLYLWPPVTNLCAVHVNVKEEIRNKMKKNKVVLYKKKFDVKIKLCSPITGKWHTDLATMDIEQDVTASLDKRKTISVFHSKKSVRWIFTCLLCMQGYWWNR